MVARKHSQQKRPINPVQASKGTDKGHKRAPKRLREIIAMVNLIPPDIDLPPAALFPSGLRGKEPPFTADQMLLAAIENLPPELDTLRLHLLEYANREDVKINPPSVLPETVKFLKAGLRYDEIREWRENLRKIARREPTIKTSTDGVIDWETGTVMYGRNAFGLAIDGVDLRYIRECFCGQIYYAPRLTYRGKEIEPRCSEKCGKKIRDRRYESRKQEYQLNRAVREADKERKDRRK